MSERATFSETAELDISRLFLSFSSSSGAQLLGGNGLFSRSSQSRDGIAIALDEFPQSGAKCIFLRVSSGLKRISLRLQGGYRVKLCQGGGWLLLATEETLPVYWIPVMPVTRKMDVNCRILEESPSVIEDMDVDDKSVTIQLNTCERGDLDCVIWRLPDQQYDWKTELEVLSSIETQRYALYGSHAVYCGPADIYQHLIFGHIYGNEPAWPHFWKITDELDAYALYLIITGLSAATGKRLYNLIRMQLVYSVVANQHEDGGWYHGEWTDLMESHYRLHCGALLVLADYLDYGDDAVVSQALKKGVEFIIERTQKTDIGLWFMHDSLEMNVESQKKSPFQWVSSRVLGKSESNMMVLNTHLDSIICVQRYREISGDQQFSDILESSHKAAVTILTAQPVEGLYKSLFTVIGWTLLPTCTARALPIYKRMLKRIAWKYLIPRLKQVINRWPRLVMPNGFIVRDLMQKGGPGDPYQSVNIMDLVRYQHRFPRQEVKEIIERALLYTQESGIRAYWKEVKGKRHALIYWAEALYRYHLLNPTATCRSMLIEAVLDLNATGQGIPPSLLGANAEAVTTAEQCPTLDFGSSSLVVVNLGRNGKREFVVINVSNDSVVVPARKVDVEGLQWFYNERIVNIDKGLTVKPGESVVGLEKEYAC
jgi:hypothetical protein